MEDIKNTGFSCGEKTLFLCLKINRSEENKRLTNDRKDFFTRFNMFFNLYSHQMSGFTPRVLRRQTASVFVDLKMRINHQQSSSRSHTELL